MATDATPFQTPPSLKNAAGLSDSNEYAATWTGQSNSRPRGYASDGLEVAQELALARTGLDVTGIVIPDNAARAVGVVETLTVTTTLIFNEWNTNAWLRLGVMAFATAGAPELGYAQVIQNGVNSITVKWISLPVNDQTINGYLVRDPYPGFNGRPGGARYYGYEQVRVLTPYTPLKDIESPTVGETVWLPPQHAEYAVVDGPLRTGKRLLLPAPWTLPTAVTLFDDLGVFLPLTRREGSHGYGISEIADATYAGTGAPTGHPLIDITGNVYTFTNAVSASVDLASGYLIVEWSASQGSAIRRSWARIASSTTTTFTVDAASWLGDGAPSRSPATEDTTGTLAFSDDSGTLLVTWTTHGFLEGDRVAFVGGDLPSGVTAGQPYVVRYIDANTFHISETLDHSPLAWVDAGTGLRTAYEVWWYTAWIGHWRDNPYMWLPGPEFGYPNEDQQPHGTFVHWRARGQLLFVHMAVVEPPANDPAFTVLNFYPFDGVSDARFGAMLPFAWRLAAALGKRINMVCLGVNGAPLVPSHVQNYFAYPGRVGWWEYDRYGYGLSLENSESMLSARLKQLITVIAVQALLAESNSKPIRYVSSCHVQGETDALLDAGRELYGATITDYKRWLRDQFDAISASPYENGALVPFAQPLLTRDPWESAATSGTPDFQTFGYDTQGDCNDNIRRAHTADPFADYSITEDIPKQIYDQAVGGLPAYGVIDNAHFSGQGMVWQGSRLAKVVLELIEYAFSHSATALATTNARLLRVANNALLFIGQGARQITSLAGTTTEATLIRTLLPEATRQLLSMRPWSWATRLEPATSVHHDNPRWKAAYAVPGRAITVLEIIAPQDDSSSSLLAAPVPIPIDIEFPPAVAEPEAFEIMRDQSGARILFTDVEEIAGDLTETEVADGQLHPERLPIRPLIRYVDHALDPNDYSESFTTALTWLLASMLAPSLVKGTEGDRVAAQALLKCGGFIRVEAEHETNTQHPRVDLREEHRPSWISGR